jgi:transposase
MKVANPPALTEFDQRVFAMVVPEAHYLRRVVERIDFERFRPRFQDAYRWVMGRPPIDPVRMLKILFLRFHYRINSDRAVLARTGTDMAFRWFLGLGLGVSIPHHTDCTNFRKRIGSTGFTEIFQDLVTLAREHGLVRDRLRLKDATHMFAAVTDMQPLALVAQVRDRLLYAATPFFAAWVATQQAEAETIRQTTQEWPDEERLSARLEHLQRLTADLQDRLPLSADTGTDNQRQRLERAVAVTAKLFADHADPKAGDRLVSGVDPEVRVGKHGAFYRGFLLDMAMDPDSEIITAINVIPANGAEATDAITLLQQEESAQHNDVPALSMDGAGHNGAMLRALTDPAGLNVDVTVPVPNAAARKTFGPERFTLQVISEEVSELTCPHGQTTRRRERNRHDTADKYIFKAEQCRGCPLREACLENPRSARGRSVMKNDYEAEYTKVRAKAGTPEYQATRSTHAKVERKLGELANRHGARRALFRGRAKVLGQALLTGLAVNIKRIVKLLSHGVPSAPDTLPLRAEAVMT